MCLNVLQLDDKKRIELLFEISCLSCEENLQGSVF